MASIFTCISNHSIFIMVVPQSLSAVRFILFQGPVAAIIGGVYRDQKTHGLNFSIATVLYFACVHMYIVSIIPLPRAEISRGHLLG